MRSLARRVMIAGNYVSSMGRNQLIAIAPDGGMTGASDPRRDGGVAAVNRR